MPRRLFVTAIKRLLPAFAALTLAQGCSQIKTPEPKPYIAPSNSPAISELRWSNGKRPKTLDPVFAAAPPETDLARALFDGLTEIDPLTLQTIPSIAEKWEHSDDWRTWRFYIREDALWTNGQPVTASDFVRSWTRYARMGSRSAFPELLANLRKTETPVQDKKTQTQIVGPETTSGTEQRNTSNSGKQPFNDNSSPKIETTPQKNELLNVVAESERVLKIDLARPDPDFPALAAHPVFRPVFGDGTQFSDLNDFTGKFVTNGAFRVERIADDEISLVPFEKYWDRSSVKIDRVRMVAADPEKALDAYKAGDLDVVSNAELSAAAIKLLEPYEDFRRVTHAAVNLYEFNLSKTLLSDHRIRRALAMAIERERLVEGELQGTVRPAYDYFPFRQQPEYRITQDLQAAKSLLAQAGYPDGVGFPTLQLVINRNDLQIRVARAVARMWKQNLGIETEIVIKEQNEIEAIRVSGEYDLIRRGVVFPVPDETVALTAVYGDLIQKEDTKSGNQTKTSPETVSAAGNQIQARVNQTQSSKVKAEVDVSHELRAIPLYFPTAVSLAKPYVKGMEPNMFDIVLLKRVEIDTQWQGR